MTATCTDVGNTSFDDCEQLTWSLGWTGLPSAREASVASTSFMFMFELVPEPVWYTSTGNSASYIPEMTSSAADAIACAMLASSTPSSAFANAADFLICARAAMWADSSVVPEMGKFSTARCV